MIPASLVGVLSLLALIPGGIFLRATDRKRSPSGDASAVEEILTLVSAGAATVLPPIVFALVAFPKEVASSVATVRAFDRATESDARDLGWSLIVVVVASILLSWLYAKIFNRFSKVEAAPDIWGPALDDTLEGNVLMIAVKMIDGTLIQGTSDGYSTGQQGRDRDLMLKSPISVQKPEGKMTDSPYRRTVISESQIAYFTSAHMPDPPQVDRKA